MCSLVNFTNALFRRGCYSHLTDETGSQPLSDLPKIGQLVQGKARIPAGTYDQRTLVLGRELTLPVLQMGKLGPGQRTGLCPRNRGHGGGSRSTPTLPLRGSRSVTAERHAGGDTRMPFPQVPRAAREARNFPSNPQIPRHHGNGAGRRSGSTSRSGRNELARPPMRVPHPHSLRPEGGAEAAFLPTPPAV